jgi:hypothetical protein
MSRRRISIPVAILTLAALAVSASDFWVSKEWKQWSKTDCEALLLESPWAHVWRGGPSEEESLVYDAQLRSALPVRQAIVRQLQLDQKYDKMSDAQRSTFDTQAGQILNHSYDDVILVHIDFSKSKAEPGLAGDFHGDVQNGEKRLDALLVTEDGSQLKPARFDPKKDFSFDLVFPRMNNGSPAIKEAQKYFSIQFQSPQHTGRNGSNIVSERVTFKFDLSKMVVNGKPSF